MKTAMQEMIDYFEKQISEYPEDCKKGHIPRDVLNGMHHSNCNALAMAKKLLEKDKIELPSHRDITERANQQVDKTIDNYFVGFAACSEYYEQILRQNK